ncbi:unnamed protein product [Adineta ricciae]|uniref:Choline/ethanolamine kinase n=1 Tax=Adineta ricciae TaxID=249248 RepID=A0A815PH84_ADIRI|nr:unnamed protein product [Adineta ricciae]CAF1583449.1 unnamed protein product [Adineta ricciae]
MSFANKIIISIHRVVEPVKKLLQRSSGMSREKVSASQALEWCQNFLSGAWTTITVEQMRMDRITGGLSNYLYCCSLPDNIETQNNEPRKILLRIYGESHRQHRGTLLIDSVVCTLLSERKIGPRVHGIFPEGRLEEFVDAESLLASEIRDETISQKLAGLLSEIHRLEMPLVKEPSWLYRTIERYLVDLPTNINRFEREEDRAIFKEFQAVCNFKEEYDNMKSLLSTIDSPVCFSHNDFQPGNILRLKSQPDNYTVIDFEYCSYNYRGFDIGNHFCEFMFDYKSATEWPFYKVDFTLYPNETQQTNFISAYINSLKTDSDRAALTKQVMKEANYFALASHFMWTLWAINMAVSTSIKFGYMEYARSRFTAYCLQRDMLADAYNNNEGRIPPKFDEELLCSSKNPFYQTYTKN